VRLNSPQAARNRLRGVELEAPDDPYPRAVRAALTELGLAQTPRDPAAESGALPKELAERLFKGVRKVSVSQLERYIQCPFQHFARYTLRPEEFHEFALRPQDAGEFYHAALELFLRENGGRLDEMTAEQSMLRMDELTSTLMRDLSERALGEGATAKAQGEELRQVARRAAATVVSQLAGSKFLPAALEIKFGDGEPSVALGGSDPSAGPVALGGRIDRIDAWQEGERRYLRVIDYKSGNKSVSLSEIYHGLQLQLMVYLAAALKREGGRPAGAFYFHVADKPIDTESRDPEEVERLRLKELRLRGVVLKDARVIGAMADRPEQALAVRIDKQGLPFSDVGLEAEDFDLLIGHALGRAEQAFKRMSAGGIEARPFLLSGRSACDHCDFAALCQRETRAVNNALTALNAKDVLARLRDET